MIVFGKNVAKEVIDSKKEIKKVYLSNNFDDEKIIKYLEENNIKINRMDKRILDNKFKGNNQGIALEIEDYKYYELDDVLNSKFLVMLDHLEDPHNFGAIIRTAEAAGVDAIIIPKKRSVEITSTVMKVSAGALNNIKIVEVSSLPQTIEKLKKYGFWFYGTDMDGSNYTDVVYDEKTCLIIGAEGNGISKLVSEKCDFIISIPMIITAGRITAWQCISVFMQRLIKTPGVITERSAVGMMEKLIPSRTFAPKTSIRTACKKIKNPSAATICSAQWQDIYIPDSIVLLQAWNTNFTPIPKTSPKTKMRTSGIVTLLFSVIINYLHFLLISFLIFFLYLSHFLSLI